MADMYAALKYSVAEIGALSVEKHTQNAFAQHRAIVRARQDLHVRVATRRLQNTYRCHLARKQRSVERGQHSERLHRRHLEKAALITQLAWQCHRYNVLYCSTIIRVLEAVVFMALMALRGVQ